MKKKHKTALYDIISLGYNCLPRFYLTHHYLKKTKRMGELSMPFDLVLQPAVSVIRFLKTDFEDYFKGLEYKPLHYWQNLQYEIKYNHDYDCKENDKTKLIQRFEKRIQNFRERLVDDKFIFFVHNNIAQAEEINELYNVLKEIRNEKTFKLIVLDLACKLDNGVNEDISIFRKMHPFSDFEDWWKPSERTPAAMAFRKELIDFIKQEIQKDFELVLYKPSFFSLDGKPWKLLKQLIKPIFTVTNLGKHKLIVILGIKIKFKRQSGNIQNEK